MTVAYAPAFGELHIHHFQNEDAEGKHDNVVPRWHSGLTKREWFAGMALQNSSLIEHMETARQLIDDPAGPMIGPIDFKMTAEACVKFADALIAELSKP